MTSGISLPTRWRKYPKRNWGGSYAALFFDFDPLFAEDLSVFFPGGDCAALPAHWTPSGGGAQQSAQVLLDAPDAELIDGAVRSREYAITYAANQLAGLKTGETVTVNALAYTVREVAALDDGALMRATLAKT